MTRDVRAANEAAWNLVAAKFAPEVARDVEFLRGGGSSLLPVELEELPPLLSSCGRAIHLQCSHGMDALSLWRLGAREIVGVDLAAEMLALARRKSELLGAPAAWHRADVLSSPPELAGTADLVYTGKGALCWVTDLARWADVVARLLVPGGHFYVYEGHPLNWIWEPEAADLELRTGASYFDREARPNRDFPGLWLERAAMPGESAIQAFERHWSLGEIVSALARAGLELLTLREHATDFWPQLPRVPAERASRVPHTFSLSMRARS
jgi:SAM-dependent methyltransferase